ncbi:hypothetical protein BDB01DRAFT_834406 [Pilobolus umbonatus]|nr:hypothetical protein BDB01DRAFT_834406 [Pilobolus umbonatus]
MVLAWIVIVYGFHSYSHYSYLFKLKRFIFCTCSLAEYIPYFQQKYAKITASPQEKSSISANKKHESIFQAQFQAVLSSLLQGVIKSEVGSGPASLHMLHCCTLSHANDSFQHVLICIGPRMIPQELDSLVENTRSKHLTLSRICFQEPDLVPSVTIASVYPPEETLNNNRLSPDS